MTPSNGYSPLTDPAARAECVQAVEHATQKLEERLARVLRAVQANDGRAIAVAVKQVIEIAGTIGSLCALLGKRFAFCWADEQPGKPKPHAMPTVKAESTCIVPEKTATWDARVSTIKPTRGDN